MLQDSKESPEGSNKTTIYYVNLMLASQSMLSMHLVAPFDGQESWNIVTPYAQLCTRDL